MTDYDPRPLTDAELLAWAVVLAYRQQQTEEGVKFLLFPQPDCPDCGRPTESSVLWLMRDRLPGEHRLVLQPCGHGFTADDEDVHRIGDHAREIVRLMTAASNSQDPDVRSWTPDDVVREARSRVGEPEQAAAEATDSGPCPACRRADQAGLAPNELHPECVEEAA
ncbi:hypothetical protein ABZ341_18170 [Streptomyces sp. NPDC006173]|uniref:hypothetical protein n=1 Tax=Streptomyces sp. NPDC006173 TaxID=3155349 RepID=UPI00340713EF